MFFNTVNSSTGTSVPQTSSTGVRTAAPFPEPVNDQSQESKTPQHLSGAHIFQRVFQR